MTNWMDRNWLREKTQLRPGCWQEDWWAPGAGDMFRPGKKQEGRGREAKGWVI